MEEAKKEEVHKPAQPPAAAPSEQTLTQELECVRGRNKLLKIVTIVLSSFFIILVIGAAVVYHKISRLTSMFTEKQEYSSPQDFNTQFAVPGQPPQSSFAGVYASTQNSSSLMMFTGLDQPQEAVSSRGLPKVPPQQLLALVAKYSQRPIVKELMDELGKDPEVKKAIDGGGPMALVAAMQNQKNMQRVMMKFAMRPEFISLMQDLMSDPMMKPILSQVPGSANASQIIRSVPGGRPQAAQEPQTFGIVQDIQTSTGGAVIDSSAMGVPQGTVAPEPIRTKTPPPMSE